MAIPEVDKSLTKGFAGNSGERQEREWPHKEWWAWVDLNHRPRPYQGLLYCYMHSSVAMITLLTTSLMVTSWHDCWFQVARCVVPNIGRQLILERCIHGVAEQFQSRIRPEGNSTLHNQPLLVVHDDLQALELVAIHGPNPTQEGSALIELKLGCIGTGTTRSARLSENRRADFTPL